jgi:Sulfotransferase family
MIISHKNKYIQVLNGGTGSSSMSLDLLKFYDGEEILWKHAKLRDMGPELLAQTNEYFTFAGVRNPLDRIITMYIRNLTEPVAKVREDMLKAQRDGALLEAKGLETEFKRREFTQMHSLSFPEFFERFLKGGKWNAHKELDTGRVSYIYRYETLQTDFSNILAHLKLKQVRELPNTNPTAGKNPDYLSYYTSSIIPGVMKYTEESMRVLGYSFPSEWVS